MTGHRSSGMESEEEKMPLSTWAPKKNDDVEKKTDDEKKRLNDDLVVFMRKRSETEAPRYTARLKAYVDFQQKRRRSMAARKRSQHIKKKHSRKRVGKEVDKFADCYDRLGGDIEYLNCDQGGDPKYPNRRGHDNKLQGHLLGSSLQSDAADADDRCCCKPRRRRPCSARRRRRRRSCGRRRRRRRRTCTRRRRRRSRRRRSRRRRSRCRRRRSCRRRRRRCR